MANDNDFVQKHLDALKDESFQPNAAHARIRMRTLEAPRGRVWRWAAIPAAAVLAVGMVHMASSVARAHNSPSPALEHLHFFLMAHWNGIVRLVHHSPLFNSAPETVPAKLEAVEPVRIAAFQSRPAPELTIREASGRQTELSSQKGKVVVVQFLYTWCPHCKTEAATLARMQEEWGSRGLQVFGVAFNDEVNTPDVAVNEAEVDKFARLARYLVGTVTRREALEFLGIPSNEAFGVPQIVVIDRDGMIQAQTKPRPAQGDLIEEPVLRETVDRLLSAR